MSVTVVGARLVNVSAYGMLIQSLVRLEPETVLPFRLVVDGVGTDLEARVVTCAPVPGSRGFGIGLEFTYVAPALRQRLSRALAPGAEPARGRAHG